MARVLQLVQRDRDFQTQRSVELLTRELGAGFHVETRIIGHGGDYRSAVLAALALRRERGFEIVHAWGLKALAAAGFGFSGKIVYTPDVPFSHRAARWLRAVMGYRNVHAVVPTATTPGLLDELNRLADIYNLDRLR